MIDDRFDRSWTLNETSLVVVTGLLQGDSLPDVTQRYAEAFEIGQEEAQADVEALLTALERQQLLATRRREEAVARQEAVDQVMRHPAALVITRILLDGFTWYFRLIHKVLGRDSVG